MWSDKETNIDYLGFGYMVDTVANVAMDQELSPSAIGIYGEWGSGKSSLMNFARDRVEELSKKKSRKDKGFQKTLCVDFDAWLFEGFEDANSSLCGTILDALDDESRFGPDAAKRAKEMIKKVDFKKIFDKSIRFGVGYLITGGAGAVSHMVPNNFLPSASLLASGRTSPIEFEEDDPDALKGKIKKDEKTRTEVKNFKKEFKELLDLSKVDRVVVFVDGLDQCAPETVTEVLETMHLFLFVKGVTFVVSADERLMRNAINSRFMNLYGSQGDAGKAYLEKVIQYPVYLPQPNCLEVTRYLVCLLLEKDHPEALAPFLDAVCDLKPEGSLTMELLSKYAPNVAEHCKQPLSFASQIAPMLAISVNGNPRQCKRFLNLLYLRKDLAKSRKVTLDEHVLAKLMLAEFYKSDFFEVLRKEENRGALKSFEKGDRVEEGNPFKKWKNDEWVKAWRKNGPSVSHAQLEQYLYFANTIMKQ